MWWKAGRQTTQLSLWCPVTTGNTAKDTYPIKGGLKINTYVCTTNLQAETHHQWHYNWESTFCIALCLKMLRNIYVSWIRYCVAFLPYKTLINLFCYSFVIQRNLWDSTFFWWEITDTLILLLQLYSWVSQLQQLPIFRSSFFVFFLCGTSLTFPRKP